MSNGTPNNSDLVNFRVVSEEEYQANLKRAEEAQAQLDHFKSMNEAAKKAYDKQQELLRRIQEGKEAERQLQALTGKSGSVPLALAGSSGQTNPSSTTQWWHPPPYVQQYGMGHYTTQVGNQPSGSSLSGRQYGDTFVQYLPAQQPQAAQPVHSQNHVQPQQNTASGLSRTTARPSVRQQVPVQQGRQALPMQPLVSTLQSNQAQAVSQSLPVASPITSVRHSGQSRPHAQSGQGAAVPNFVTSSGTQQYQAPLPSESSLYGALDASKATNASQPALSTAVSLSKVATKQSETDLSATAMKLQAQLHNKGPSQSNLVSLPPSAGGSSQQIDLPADITTSWQRFSQSIVGWASTATAPSEMPLSNTKIKVVKEANSQVFITIPGTGSHNPITITLQTLLATVHVNGTKTSTPDQRVTAEPSNKTNAPDSRNGYRPYSVPQHQSLQASASSGASSVSINPPENSVTSRPTTTSAPIALSTPTKSSAASPASGRTPSQADKKSLAKDILRALSAPSLKRPHPDEASVMQTLEPPVKRHASGPAPQTSEALDVMPQASIKIVSASSGQASSTSVPSALSETGPLVGSSTIPSESALPQTSNSHLTTAPATVPNTNQLHSSSIQATHIVQISQDLPSHDDNQHSISKNLFPERPKTPLFLPSPSSSPITGPREPIQEISLDLNRDVALHVRRRTQPFYIFVPPAPLWLQECKAQQLRNKGRRLVNDDESERQSSSGGAMGGGGQSIDGDQRAEEVEDEDIDVIDLDPANDLTTDEFEREAILLSCSRIRERPCKWNSCNVVLNSTEKLIRHLAYAHQEIFEEFSVCRWQHCGQSVVTWAELFRHLKGHVLTPLQCAYQDCQESFRTPRRLVKHHQAEHRKDLPKLCDTPFVPTLKTPPDASQPILPSYLMEPIQRPPMTKDRHGNLGPWVLRQIAGPVDHEVKRYNAASKLLQSPSRSDKQEYQPYDFLSFPSTNYSSAPSLPSKIRGMEDLISGEVTDMVHNGLVLWGPQEESEDEDEDEDELLLPSSPLLQPHSDAEATTEEQMDVNAVQFMLEN